MSSQPSQARSQPWRPPLSTDAAVEKPKCLGDLVREQAEREGRIGAERIGTPSGGNENSLIESWYDRHHEKLVRNPVAMAAVKAAEAKRQNNATAELKRKRKGEGERKAERKHMNAGAGWNTHRRRKMPLTAARPPACRKPQERAGRQGSPDTGSSRRGNGGPRQRAARGHLSASHG